MPKKITNPVYKDLVNLKLISDKNLIKINNTTRDKKINVLQDIKSKIIFLEKFKSKKNYYQNEKGATRSGLNSITKFVNGKKIKTAKVAYKNKKNLKNNIVGDDYRRFDQFKSLIKNKYICDFGCGYGGFLTLAKNISKKLYGVELNNYFINYLNSKKSYIETSTDLENFNIKFDIITLFHVFEHLPNQIKTLKKIRENLKNKGKLILEVPHANDLLIKKTDIKKFKDFIFWSEHLILHTRESLYHFLKFSGFKKIKIINFQRYNLSNHIHWLINEKPGGHINYKKFFSSMTELNYNKILEKNNLTDTLIAIAEK